MSHVNEPILHIPKNVREDILGYREKLSHYKAGHMTPTAFKVYRVSMGIYEQRKADTYMARIRIGAGIIRDFQFERVAQLSKRYGDGIVHVTTRQDAQIHNVSLEHTADVQESLLEVELVTRGGGGNTVRNITACPRCGLCPKEVFDVGPYAIAMAEYLLSFTSSYNLPRKFKIVFSGCPADCAFASAADLGFFAHVKDGERGFVVYGGGGLGPHARVAILLDEFIAADRIFIVAEALKRVFDQHGDRQNRHRARLRYVLDRLGENGFVELYRKEKMLVEQESDGVFPEIRPIRLSSLHSSVSPPVLKTSTLLPSNAEPEKEAGYVTLALKLEHGDIPADDAIAVSAIAGQYGSGLIRTTQLQDILIPSVYVKDVEKVIELLGQLSVNVLDYYRPKIVTCTGAATCKLGLCLSRGLADEIAGTFGHNAIPHNGREISIRISGCPNSCASHYLADMGFEGRARRIKGRLMPYYEVFSDAEIHQGRSRLAAKRGALPAKVIPEFVREYIANGPTTSEQLSELIARYSALPDDIPEAYYYDYGVKEPFSLSGRGPGECGAGVMDIIRMDINEAKEAIKNTPVASENVYKAIVASSRALLITFGLEPRSDRKIFSAFTRHMIEPGWVAAQTQSFLDEALDWKIGDKESIVDMLIQTEELISRIDDLFLSLDANLKFKARPIGSKINETSQKTENAVLDLRGVACPLNFVKAKLELEKRQTGGVLEILLDEGEPVRNVPASFTEQGHDILEVKNIGGYYSVKVRRKK